MSLADLLTRGFQRCCYVSERVDLDTGVQFTLRVHRGGAAVGRVQVQVVPLDEVFFRDVTYEDLHPRYANGIRYIVRNALIENNKRVRGQGRWVKT